jgi:EAL and modified HD-GYP domain-containing signal transduction protein
VSASPQTGAVPPPVLISPAAEPCTRYIARQPILNREQNTHGYELLFRAGPETFFRAQDPDGATCNTIDFSLLFGSAALTGGHPAYINCTRNILLREVITLLPRDRVVVEVLEDVIADEEMLAACDRLRRTGYRIALDDYVPTADSIRLLQFADLVKVDFLSTDAECQAAIAADMRRRGIKLVAEKVETRQQFQYALGLAITTFRDIFSANRKLSPYATSPATSSPIFTCCASLAATFMRWTNWSKLFCGSLLSATVSCAT